MRRNLATLTILMLAIACILLFSSTLALAQTPHEDPEAAKETLSSISLLRYYLNTLDFLLKMDPEAVKARLEKMPFANVPENLKEVMGSFATYGINISHLVVSIDKDLKVLGKLIAEAPQSEEAIELLNKNSAELFQASADLDGIEHAIKISGEERKAVFAPPDSGLRKAYNEAINRLDELRRMFDLYKELSTDLLLGVRSIENPLHLTEISLRISPLVASMGEEIRFEGRLTSERKPLSGRGIDILLNGTQYTTTVTREDGHYRGTIEVPYRYIQEMSLQALYYPRDEDMGFYLASRSPLRKLKVLSYPAELELRVEGKAYPGREIGVVGKFDYADLPVPEGREIEIYLDDTFITKGVVPETFSLKIMVNPETKIGRHVITVSAPAMGKYAPVVRSAFLNVTPVVNIDINMPRVALIPGSIDLRGKLSSGVDPLSNAQIKLSLGSSQAETTSSEDGTLEAKIKKGMGWEFFGSQVLKVQVIPQEPWHASVGESRDLFVVNLVNSGGILAILIFLSIWLPGRLRKRLRARPSRETRPIAQPQPALEPETLVPIPSLIGRPEVEREPRSKILGCYQQVVKLIQGITRAVFPPQQTPREFLKEISPSLGPTARLFEALTRLVERLFYSSYKPTEEDAESGEKLSQDIEKEIKK